MPSVPFIPQILAEEFDPVVRKLREFFHSKGFIEGHYQNRLSILAACEDPFTVSTFDYAGQVWPLPQTNQMILEDSLLRAGKNSPGLFCISTSYRNEPDPIPGRHSLIFPMFELEMPGTLDDLIQLEKELCEHLGFGKSTNFPEMDYESVCKLYNKDILETEDETRLCEEFGSVVFLKNFPERTSPFWNMRRYENKPELAKKCDVIIEGQETIGSAERSCDVDQMRETFHTISNGEYAKLLYSKFGKDRVEAELEEFLSFDFFPRVGGGIGMTRLISAMKKQKLI